MFYVLLIQMQTNVFIQVNELFFLKLMYIIISLFLGYDVAADTSLKIDAIE